MESRAGWGQETIVFRPLLKLIDTFLKLLGDDIFVSYSRADGGTFAAGLATELTARGLRCRLDQWGAESGKQMPESLKAALRRSTLLVLVGTEGAARSVHVCDEVRTMKHLKRPIVPIVFEGVRLREDKTPKAGKLVRISDLPPDADVANAPEAVWAPEIEGQAITCEDSGALQTGKPSDKALNTIRQTFTFLTLDQRLRISATVAGVILLALIGASTVAGIQARRSKGEATQAEARAVEARGEAQAAATLRDQAKADAQAAKTEKLTAENLRDSALHEARTQYEIALARKLSSLANGLRERAVAIAGRTAWSREERSPWLLETSLLLGIKALKTWKAFDVMDTVIEARALFPPRVQAKGAWYASEIAFSPNGKYLLQLHLGSIFNISELRALDLATGAETIIDLREEAVFADNLKYFAGAGLDSPPLFTKTSQAKEAMVSIFDSDTLKPVASFALADADIDLRGLSPSGRYTLLQNRRNHEYVIAAEGLSNPIPLTYRNPGDAAFAAGDAVIVQTKEAVEALAIDSAGGAISTKWKVPAAAARNLLISPDGRWAAVSIGGTVSILRTSDGASLCSVNVTSPVMQLIGPVLRFSPDGEHMALAVNGSTTMYAIENCRRLFSNDYVLDGDLPQLGFSVNGEWFLLATREGTYVFDSATGETLAALPEENPPNLRSGNEPRWAAVNSSGTLTALTPDVHSHDGLHLYDTGQLPYRISAFDDAETLSFSRDGTRLLQYKKGVVNVFATDTRRLIAHMPVTGTFRRFHFESENRIYALEEDGIRTFDYVKRVELPRRAVAYAAENYVLRQQSVWVSSSGQHVTVNPGTPNSTELIMLHDDGSMGQELSLVPYAAIPYGSTLDISTSGRFVTTGRVVYDTLKKTTTKVLEDRGVDAMIDTDDRFLVAASANGDIVIHDLVTKTNVYRHAMGREVHVLAAVYSKSRSEIYVAYKYWRNRPGIFLRSLSWKKPEELANSACTWIAHDLELGDRQRYLGGDREPICVH